MTKEQVARFTEANEKGKIELSEELIVRLKRRMEELPSCEKLHNEWKAEKKVKADRKRKRNEEQCEMRREAKRRKMEVEEEPGKDSGKTGGETAQAEVDDDWD